MNRYRPSKICIANRRHVGRASLCWRVPVLLLLWLPIAVPFVAALVGLQILRTYAEDLPRTPDLEAWEQTAPRTSYITAADGTVLAEIPFRDGPAAGHRVPVRFAQIPPTMLLAVLAAEDARFFGHRGVDLVAIARAAWVNYRAGRVIEGASTITQQVARNLLPQAIGNARTLRRKVREALLARRIERRYDKRRILEVYVNHIFLGAGAYGIAAAARAYFDKSLHQLDLAEMALIAGLGQAPGRADPYRDPAAARVRRDQVLERMARTGAIAPAAARAAQARPVTLTRRPLRYGTLAPWYTERARQEIQAAMPAGYQRGGLHIETAAVPVLAIAAEDAARGWVDQLAATRGRLAQRTGQDGARPEVGGLVWDYRTGYIEATVGGRSWRESRFDRATQACRQPGSAFKPIVYAAALAADAITPGTALRDAPVSIYDSERNVHWKPRNSRAFRGVALAQEALAASLNAPAIDVLERVGTARVIELARRLGITTEIADALPVALGASCVVPLELAGAFAAVARGGTMAAPIFVVRVRRGREVLVDRASPYDPRLRADRRLDRLSDYVSARLQRRQPRQTSDHGRNRQTEQHGQPRPMPSPSPLATALGPISARESDGDTAGDRGHMGMRVLDRGSAFLLSTMLTAVVERGTATAARQLGRPAAGKTGTTNGNTDAWFVGYTGRVLGAVWVGYDDPAKTLGPHQDGARAALPLWLRLMRLAEGARPPVDVPGAPPPGLVRVRIDRDTGLLARPDAADGVPLWFKAGTEPIVEAGQLGELPADLGRMAREF